MGVGREPNQLLRKPAVQQPINPKLLLAIANAHDGNPADRCSDDFSSFMTEATHLNKSELFTALSACFEGDRVTRAMSTQLLLLLGSYWGRTI